MSKGKTKVIKVNPKPKGKDKAAGFLPTMEPFTDKKLDNQCQRLMDARAAISEARGHEHDVHAKLDEMMLAANVAAYEYKGKIFGAKITRKITYKERKKNDPAKTAEKHGINPGSNDGPDMVDLDAEEGEEKKEFVDAVTGETSTDPK
jgi:hypothetical protein